MTTFILYGVLGLLISLPASFFGISTGEAVTGLTFAKSPILKRIKIKFGYDEFEANIISLVISGLLIGYGLFYLISNDILRLSVLGVILGIIGLLLAGGIIGFLVTFLLTQILVAVNSSIRKDVRKMKDSIKAMDKRDALEKRKQGTPDVKVYRCGLCGETSPAGRYVVNSQGMALCQKHAHLASRSSLNTSYECPSCGYKFAPKDNWDYFDKHVCSNCGRHLDDTSWGPI